MSGSVSYCAAVRVKGTERFLVAHLHLRAVYCKIPDVSARSFSNSD